MTSMNFPTLPYDNVTYSFLLEICFWGPTYPTFLYDVTLLDLFFFELFPNLQFLNRIPFTLMWVGLSNTILVTTASSGVRIMKQK